MDRTQLSTSDSHEERIREVAAEGDSFFLGEFRKCVCAEQGVHTEGCCWCFWQVVGEMTEGV